MTQGTITICGASIGHYGRPWKINGSRGIKRWVDDKERIVNSPRTFSCESSRHLGRKRRFTLAEGYVQRWVLTKREALRAFKNWDVFSLTMLHLLLCSECARKERTNHA